MKKLNIALFMLFSTVVASAQFNKGRMLVGGTGSFKISTEKLNTGGSTTGNGKWTTISLTPQYGYFIINNLAIGAGVDLSTSMYRPGSDNSSDYDYSSLSFEVKPFIRYYLKPGIFFQGTYGIGSEKYNSTYQGSSEDFKVGRFSWALAGGYAIFLNDHVAIEPTLGYEWNTRNYDATANQGERKYSTSSLFLRVGIQVYIGRKE